MNKGQLLYEKVFMLRIRVGRAIDLTHEIQVGIAVYPGDAEPEIERIKELDKN